MARGEWPLESGEGSFEASVEGGSNDGENSVEPLWSA